MHRWCRWLVAVSMLAAPAAAWAGLIRVHCDPGTTVTVFAFDKDNEQVGKKQEKKDVNNDGIVEFGYTLSQQAVIKSVQVIKVSDGEKIVYDVNFTGGGVTELSASPFEIPEFNATNPQGPLRTQIDFTNFENEGRVFATGEILPVVGGILPGSPSLFFTIDEFGPPYSGLVTVGTFDQFLLPPVTPEPGSLLLFGAAGLVLAGVARWRARRR